MCYDLMGYLCSYLVHTYLFILHMLLGSCAGLFHLSSVIPL